ncbi:MAG: UDP-N-acetylmuramoyl-tripeptide--D-alanyl-D-alanine ligase [Proteobacteria bacterium]|nr:UDP-N-acetylmuramoyl-tripeptide--D-alanyl-D-alanine ligase [Pseudomonadota bacterium]
MGALTRPLWEWQELLQALALDEPSAGGDVTGISIDSRTLSSGDLFIALAGDPVDQHGTGRDGHAFVGSAEQAGASALLVARKVDAGIPALVVKDTLDALWSLGAAGRTRMSGRIVAITGSAGKTTARHWLQTVLQAEAITHGSVGSYNNHWGVPLSLARMPRNAAFGVFEIGMNHAGEIQPLAELVAPHLAIVLNVLPAHIGNLGSLDAIRKEKLSIRAGLKSGGTLICPLELGVAGSFTFAVNRQADIWAEPVGSHQATVHIDGRRHDLHLALGGEHRLQTALAVLAAVHCLGADVEAAVRLIPSLDAPAGRGNRYTIAGRTVIDDSYNANPASMSYALDALRNESGRGILLVGEMLELGSESTRRHQAVAKQARNIPLVYSFGDQFSGLDEVFGPGFRAHYQAAPDFDIDDFVAATRPGDVILVKGSNRVFWVHDFVSRLCAAMARTQA